MTTLYVSPTGNDSWSGRLAEANAERTDGPLATVVGARNRVRHRGQPPAYHNSTWAPQEQTGPVTVQLRGGVYPLAEPLSFGPDDSAGVTYSAYPGESPVLDGGQRLSGWRLETVHDRACWVLDLPEVARGEWNFHGRAAVLRPGEALHRGGPAVRRPRERQLRTRPRQPSLGAWLPTH